MPRPEKYDAHLNTRSSASVKGMSCSWVTLSSAGMDMMLRLMEK